MLTEINHSDHIESRLIDTLNRTLQKRFIVPTPLKPLYRAKAIAQMNQIRRHRIIRQRIFSTPNGA